MSEDGGKFYTKYKTEHRLAFMELSQLVVSVEEDDESDKVDDKKTDDSPA